MLIVPRVDERRASGVGRHICRKEEIVARNGHVGSQCSGRAVIDGYETHDEGIICFSQRMSVVITCSFLAQGETFTES